MQMYKYFGLKSNFKLQLLSRKTKIIIYKTLVRPLFTYAAESCTMTKNDERKLGVLERKILLRAYVSVCEKVQRRRRYNRELGNLYNEPTIVNTTKSSRLRSNYLKIY